MDHITSCPKCGSQLQVKLTFASVPRSSEQSNTSPLVQQVTELLERIEDNDLSGATAKFVTETRERLEKYGSRIKMSDKQMAWLNRIADGETGSEW